MDFWFDNINHIYYQIIEPIIEMWDMEHEDNKIVGLGRSGGWISIDKIKADLFEEEPETRESDETEDEYIDRTWGIRCDFEPLWDFQIWFEDSLVEVIDMVTAEMMNEKKE
jgi:hypothetical protein